MFTVILAPIITLLILIGIGIGIKRIFTSAYVGESSNGQFRSAVDVGDILTYAVSFAGLMVFLYAVSSLLALLLGETLLRSHLLLSTGFVRQQTSYLLAALIVATPVWLGVWRLSTRDITRKPEERQAPERRLYLATVFAITSVVTLFSLQTVLRVLFTLLASHGTVPQDSVVIGVRLLVYGIAWLTYARLAFRERAGREPDAARDLALYVLSVFSLAFLTIGALNALAALIDELLGMRQTILLGASPHALNVLWGNIAAWLVAGGGIWAVVSRYAESYPGRRFFRTAHLYLVLAISVPTALGSGGHLLYELLRRAFGYRTDHSWNFLHEALPPLLVAGAVWVYHWMLLRRKAEMATDTSIIPWPRRPYLTTLSFVGLAIATSAAVSLLWVAIDLALKSQHTLDGADWWRDHLSAGTAFLLIGAIVWLGPWSLLQRAAALDPRERAATARRWLLGAVVLISTLVGVGFAIALLWLILRTGLGGPHDNGTIDEMLRYLTAATVAAGLVAYHGLILRADLRSTPGRVGERRLSALIAEGGEESLAALRRHGSPTEALGYLNGEAGAAAGLAEIEGQSEPGQRVLLILDRHGGIAYPYSNRPMSHMAPSGVVAPVSP